MSKQIILNFSGKDLKLSDAFSVYSSAKLLPDCIEALKNSISENALVCILHSIPCVLEEDVFDGFFGDFRESGKSYMFYDGEDIAKTTDFLIELCHWDDLNNALKQDKGFFSNNQLNYNILDSWERLSLPDKLKNYFLNTDFETYYKYPKNINLNIISRCNFECSMCWIYSAESEYRYSDDEKGIMPFEFYKKLIDEIAQYKQVPRVSISPTGELFLLKDWDKYCQYLDEKNIPFSITTNASLLSEQNIDILLTLKGVKNITISLDAVDFSLLKNIRKNINPSVVFKNIDTLVSRVRKNGFVVGINCTLGSQNQSQKKAMLEFFESEENLKYVAFFNEIDTKSTAIAKNEDFPFAIKKRIPCMQLWNQCVISFKGIVYKCGISQKYRDGILGDINQETLLSIWNSEKAHEYRQMHLSGNFTPISCKHCTIWSFFYAHRFYTDNHQVVLRNMHETFEKLV